MTVPSLPWLKPARNLAKQRPGGGPPPAWAQQIITSHSSPPHLALLFPRRTLIAHRDSLALYTGNLRCSQGRPILRLAAKGGSMAESDTVFAVSCLCAWRRVTAMPHAAVCSSAGSGRPRLPSVPSVPAAPPRRALAAGASRLCYGLVGAAAARPDRPCAGALSCSPSAPPKRQSWAPAFIVM